MLHATPSMRATCACVVFLLRAVVILHQDTLVCCVPSSTTVSNLLGLADASSLLLGAPCSSTQLSMGLVLR